MNQASRTRSLDTPHLGQLSWDSASEILLPHGLPGFEEERRMLPVEIPAHRPLVFLQSVARPDVCFAALPVNTICPEFDLQLCEEDRTSLGLTEESPCEVGADLLCLAILFPSEGSVESNLAAPVVINLHNSVCVQSVVAGRPPVRYKLSEAGAWEVAC
jgi:flagellar assembly factor FliW